MHRVNQVLASPDFTLSLEFADGLRKRVDVRPFIGEGLSAALQDWNYFRQVTVDEGGGICWPNGYDFCPNFLHDHVPALTPEAEAV